MKKKLLTLAMGSALGMSVATTPAHADALLFPIFIEGNGVFTFLTLRSDAGGAGANPLHYVWNYNDPDAGDCTHANADGTLTPFDMVQHTVSDPSLSTVDLVADFGDASNPAYLNVSPAEGFMTVRDNSGEGAFGGQAIVVDTSMGLVTAYKGLNNPVSQNEGNFSSILVSQVSHDFIWYPVSAVNTFWFFLVTGIGMDNPNGWGGAVELTHGFGGVWDRDENFRSGGKRLEVVCRAVLQPQDLLTADQLAATQNGGWTWVRNQPDFANTGATGGLVTKFEFTNVLGTPTAAISQENAFPNFPY